MEKFFLFKRKRPKKLLEDEGIFPVYENGGPFVFEKTVEAEEEVVQWIKDIYAAYEHMIIKGEEVRFEVSEKMTVDVRKK